jgi:Cysteine-rich secretory protein family
MKRVSIFLALLLPWCCPGLAQPSRPAGEKPVKEKRVVAIPFAEKQIFDELNQERKESGLPALEWSEPAAQAARNHAKALLENRTLSHQFPGEPSLPERIGATGVRFTVAAENVARTEYIEDVHPALMNSPGHRANILSSRYNAVGIGVAELEGKLYVAQDFIFTVPMYSEAQFSSAFAEAFNLARKAKRIREIDARPDALLREMACLTDGDAAKLSGKVAGARAVVVFTSSEPHGLPNELLGRAANPDFHRMNFGVCFRPDQEHGYANFWVVATFGN